MKIYCPICGQEGKFKINIIVPDGYIEYKCNNCGAIWQIGFRYQLEQEDLPAGITKLVDDNIWELQ